MEDKVYTIKIQLKRITKPPVWRQVEVLGNTKLDKFSTVILTAMGWYGYHLHAFTDAMGNEYQAKGGEFDAWDADDYEDEKKYTVAQLFMHGAVKKVSYEYDFGDGWEHDLSLKSVTIPVPNEEYPILVSGAGACPPEDCGGPYGYQDLRKIVTDPKHPEYDEMREWMGLNKGEEWNANEFNLAAFQESFKALRKKKSGKKPK